MSTVVYSPESEDDLAGIKQYIDRKLGSPRAAANLVLNITKAIRSLEESPEIGVPLSSIIDIETQYRFLVSGNYLTFYRYEKGDDTCYIIRILYGRRDYISILFNDRRGQG